MSRSVLEQLLDFNGSKELIESLKVTNSSEQRDRLSSVRLSPDGRHVHVILSKPKVGLVTFDKYERPQLAQNHRKLDLCLTRTVPIVDVLYLDSKNRSGDTLAVIYENGKAEFWSFQESKGGWCHLQSSDLCNSPRARVVSVCVSSKLIIWCEERPASESSTTLSSTRNTLRYCVCRRDFDVEEGAVLLGGVKIALHNNPKFTVISSGEYVHLLPDVKVKPSSNISKFFLSWYPHHDSFRVSTTCKNAPLKKLSAKESDFRRMVTDCLGYLSALDPPQILDFCSSDCGGLLLLLSTGWVTLLQRDGMLRRVYKLADNFSLKYGTHTSICMFQDTLAILIAQTLHLIDLKCGRELETITLKREGLLYVNQADRCTPHLLLDTGLYVVMQQEADTFKIKSSLSTGELIHPGTLLVEAVFEEACKYYQQRSLSSTQLTVEALKKGGRFQAPISLASILRDYLSSDTRQRGAELSQNGGGGCMVEQDKLTGSLEVELKALVLLEEVKGNLVKGGVEEVEAVCESLVEREVARLLSSSELDEEALLYLNSIFSIFPCQAWRAVQAALQLHFNGEGSLSSRAPPDVWKTVLNPSPTTSLSDSLPLTNGGLKHKHSLRGYPNANSQPKSIGSNPPAALPVFELLCLSLFHFQPSWLPRFLELAQQQQGSAGLSLSLAASSWSFAGGRGGEVGENNVPLYKRVLAVLSGLRKDRDQNQDLDLDVEVLMVSGRPNAILQALRVLIGKQEWERVTQLAQRFCRQSPLLNKEIFTTLLCEVTQHRDLDPYLDLLWALCPEDFTVTTILNLILKNLPSPNTPSPSSLPMSSSPSPAPFAEAPSSQLTIGLLKPLLRKVLQRETKPSQRYVDILQSPSYPPPAPPRTVTPPNTSSPLTSPEQPLSTHTPVQKARIPPNLL
ncbi:BLOC-2 complex member HPS6 [Aulostomus maculatus]